MLEKQVMDLQFENGLQAAADEGEKKKLTQENEALKAQIRKMKIAARNTERSQADERLISSLKKKDLEYQDDLEKSEASLAKVWAQLAENAKGRTQFVQQMKRKYKGTITSVKRKIVTLENEAAKQTKDFKADREHCYDLMAQMEEEMQQQVVSFIGILATHSYNIWSKNKLNMANQELEASIVDPSKEVEESEVNLKYELYKLKQQMAEMYQAWAKGHPPPNYPANPAFIPPLAQT
ncbi:spindle pole body component 110-like [Nicotiana sylvestris]|uniref:spindle pole body component 110-like n=1 Tax=Nicotiana sylvestris TaxID=4096 RepID=UPI00388C6DBF